MIISFDTFGAWATAVKEAKQEQEKNITITENGTGSVLPDSGKTLSKVDYTVDVHPKTRLNEEFTENGEYNLTGEWKDAAITVAVPQKEEQAKSVTITENGTTSVTPDAGKVLSSVAVTVNVAGGATKVDVGALKIKLGFSTFTKVPDVYDFSNCTNMSSMFCYCYSLTSVPELDTSNCTSMNSMFANCTNLTSLPVMDTSKVTDMQYMFQSCTNLTSLTLVGSLNTSLELNDSPLNEESIKSVLTAASKTTDTTAKTLTFKEGSTFTDDAEGTWAALVADCTTKGWTIKNLTITPAA